MRPSVTTLRSDPLVESFRELIPEGTIGGGSFAHWLPPCTNLPRREREELLARTRRRATRVALANVLESVGLSPAEPRSLSSGRRAWPPGFSGSISHQGTRVVVVLVSVGNAKSVGVDIESYRGAHDLLDVDGLAEVNELPPSLGAQGTVVLLSAKEAVFKAVHPLVGLRLGFSDVRVSWSRVSRERLTGTARCLDLALELRCHLGVPEFVGTIALPSAE